MNATTREAALQLIASGEPIGRLIIDDYGTTTVQVIGGVPPGDYPVFLRCNPVDEPTAPAAPTPKPKVDYASFYKPQLEKIAPGGEASIPVPLDANPKSFQACISGWCAEHWGKGNGKTVLVNGLVRVFNLLPQRQMSAVS